MSESQHVYLGNFTRLEYVTFKPDAIAGQVSCHECFGTGYWGYGPTEAECGPCVACKGTGREWVGV